LFVLFACVDGVCFVLCCVSVKLYLDANNVLGGLARVPKLLVGCGETQGVQPLQVIGRGVLVVLGVGVAGGDGDLTTSKGQRLGTSDPLHLKVVISPVKKEKEKEKRGQGKMKERKKEREGREERMGLTRSCC